MELVSKADKVRRGKLPGVETVSAGTSSPELGLGTVTSPSSLSDEPLIGSGSAELGLGRVPPPSTLSPTAFAEEALSLDMPPSPAEAAPGGTELGILDPVTQKPTVQAAPATVRHLFGDTFLLAAIDAAPAIFNEFVSLGRGLKTMQETISSVAELSVFSREATLLESEEAITIASFTDRPLHEIQRQVMDRVKGRIEILGHRLTAFGTEKALEEGGREGLAQAMMAAHERKVSRPLTRIYSPEEITKVFGEPLKKVTAADQIRGKFYSTTGRITTTPKAFIHEIGHATGPLEILGGGDAGVGLDIFKEELRASNPLFRDVESIEDVPIRSLWNAAAGEEVRANVFNWVFNRGKVHAKFPQYSEAILEWMSEYAAGKVELHGGFPTDKIEEMSLIQEEILSDPSHELFRKTR